METEISVTSHLFFFESRFKWNQTCEIQPYVFLRLCTLNQKGPHWMESKLECCEMFIKFQTIWGMLHVKHTQTLGWTLNLSAPANGGAHAPRCTSGANTHANSVGRFPTAEASTKISATQWWLNSNKSLCYYTVKLLILECESTVEGSVCLWFKMLFLSPKPALVQLQFNTI